MRTTPTKSCRSTSNADGGKLCECGQVTVLDDLGEIVERRIARAIAAVCGKLRPRIARHLPEGDFLRYREHAKEAAGARDLAIRFRRRRMLPRLSASWSASCTANAAI